MPGLCKLMLIASNKPNNYLLNSSVSLALLSSPSTRVGVTAPLPSSHPKTPRK